MSRARILVLALAAVAAIGAVFMARSFSSAPQAGPATAEPAQEQYETRQVLVAARDLNIGARVQPGDLRWADWPRQSVHASYLTESNAPEAMESYVEAVARMNIAEGEPVTPRKLIHAGDSGFMAAVLEPGMRGVAVRISPESGAGGFILPNDHVDVIVTTKASDDGGADSYVSTTVLRDVRVLAIDQTFREVDDGQVVVGQTATLELSPREAETLNLAEAQGEIALSLRSVADAANVTDIQYEDPLLDESPRIARNKGVRVIRYGSESTVQVGGN